jgi:hypothetical protein
MPPGADALDFPPPVDDLWFHPPRYRDYRWMETNWFSWLIPEALMRSHVRSGFRLNLGVVETSVIVWSSTNPRAGLLDVDFLDKRYHVPMPPQNLDNYQLANGVSVRMTKPAHEWELRFDGAHDTVFDLHYRALMPPIDLAESATDAGGRNTIRFGHLDQTMAVTGTVRIRGKNHTVNFPSNRDHSWSPRPEAPTTGYGISSATNFDVGHFGNDFTFFVHTVNAWETPETGVVTSGYLLDHGSVRRLKSGRGHYTFEDGGWLIKKVDYELEDEGGRTHVFRGEPKSFYDKIGSAGTLTVVRWTSDDGEVGWGELNWHGDMYAMQAHPRT